MRRCAGYVAAVWFGLTLCHASLAADAFEVDRARVLGAELAQFLGSACPRAAPDDEAALARCREALHRSRLLDRVVAPFVVWGGGDAGLSVKGKPSTRFNGDVFRSMYLSLFMFSGEHRVEVSAAEGVPVIRFQATFRNRLLPGLYPYPFWHAAEKWNAYQQTNEVIAYLDEDAERIVALQRASSGTDDPAVARQPVPSRAFDGKWMWTGRDGSVQPALSLFDGYFRAENPHRSAVDGAYRAFALKLRDGECLQCHVPSNPNKMKRLVLLQTPLHAAGEIERVLEDVRKDRMPREEWGNPRPLAPDRKAEFLRLGEAFAAALAQARDWEALNR